MSLLVMSFEDWPAADQSMWSTLIRTAGPLDDPGPMSQMRGISQNWFKTCYGRWLTWLAASDLRTLQEAPPERATVERIAAWLNSLTGIAPRTRANLIYGALYVLMAAAPDLDWATQVRLRSRLQSLAGRGLQTRKEGRILSSKVLLEAGLRCAHQSGEGASPLKAARLRRDGTMVAMLTLMPMRRRAFVNLEFGTSLFMQNSEILVALPEELMKGGKAWEAAVPNPILPTLQHYITEVRPWLMARNGEHHQFLWANDHGRPYSPDAFSRRMRNITEALTGVRVSPHFFRDAAATTLARISPDSARLIRPILAHSSFETAERHYNHARTIEAGRDYAEVVARLKKGKT